MKKLLLLLSHCLVGALGFAAGIYSLPLLIAPPGPSTEAVLSIGENARYTGYFDAKLAGSDHLHWAEGSVFVAPQHIAFQGKVAPGPDYKMYLSPRFISNKAEFLQHQAAMRRVGEVSSFGNLIIELPPSSDIERYNTVVIWCEAFNQFISAAQYR